MKLFLLLTLALTTTFHFAKGEEAPVKSGKEAAAEFFKKPKREAASSKSAGGDHY